MKSYELRRRVESQIGQAIPDSLWPMVEERARTKLAAIERRDPQGRGDDYLVALAAEIQHQLIFSSRSYRLETERRTERCLA